MNLESAASRIIDRDIEFYQADIETHTAKLMRAPLSEEARHAKRRDAAVRVTAALHTYRALLDD